MTSQHVKNIRVFPSRVLIREMVIPAQGTRQQSNSIIPLASSPNTEPMGAWIGQIISGEGNAFKKVIFSIGNLTEKHFNIHAHNTMSAEEIVLKNVEIQIFVAFE